MNGTSHYGMKTITAMGVFTFLFLFFSAQVLRQQIRPQTWQRPRITAKRSSFRAERAYNDLRAVLEFGPRPAGSESIERTRNYLCSALEEAGLHVDRCPFHVEGSSGPVIAENIIGIVRGNRPGILLIGVAMDTAVLPGLEFLGANASGSGTACLLELARMWGAEREGRSLWLVWYDATETDDRGNASAAALRAQPGFSNVEAAIHMAAIGDCYLTVVSSPASTEWMRGTVWNIAERLGYGAHFGSGLELDAPLRPSLRAAGIPCLDIADYPFGGTIAQHREMWHTDRDTLETVCPESLQVVGDLFYHAVPAIETELDAASEESPP